MAKTATTRARPEPDVEAEVEAVLAELGLPPTQTITFSYREIVRDQDLPFPLRLAEPARNRG